MIFTGEDFSYFVDGESKTKEEVKDLLHSNMTVTVDGLIVNFISPKKDMDKIVQETCNKLNKAVGFEWAAPVKTCGGVKCGQKDCNDCYPEIPQKKAKTEELLEEVNKHQEQNGGRVEGMEFPFDGIQKEKELPYLTEEEEKECLLPNGMYKTIRIYYGEPCKETKEKIDSYNELLRNKKGYGKLTKSDYLNSLQSEKEQKIIEDWNKAGFPPTEKLDVEKFKKKLIDSYNTPLTLDEIIGKKEKENKVDYSEINFKLLDLMAKRFNDNKHKYPKGNTLKVIDKDEILWAAFRHIRKMIQPIENDPETYEDHLAAVATNMSIILDQLYRK